MWGFKKKEETKESKDSSPFNNKVKGVGKKLEATEEKKEKKYCTDTFADSVFYSVFDP